MHAEAPAKLLEPGAQGVQNRERATLAVPAGQLSHPPVPLDEKVPAGHSTAHAEAPSALQEPAGQRMQKEEPPALKVFAGHRTQEAGPLEK